MRRVLRQGERPAERSDDVDQVVRMAVRQPLGALAVHGEDELDRAAVDTAVCHLVDRERSAQKHRAVITADRYGDELSRPGLLGDARGDDCHREVVTHLLDRQHLAANLHRTLRLADRHHRSFPRAARMT